MSRRNDYHLDDLVRSAMRSGGMRPTPLGLHARIWRRLEIAALVERERTHFRGALVRVLSIACAVFAVFAAICWLSDPLAALGNHAPGFLGLVDYSVTYAQTIALASVTSGDWWIYAGSAATLLLVFIVVGHATLARIPSRRS